MSLMKSTVMGELDAVSIYIRALIQFIMFLQKILELLGEGSTTSCKKFHVSLKEKFAYACPSKTYVLDINTILHSFVNSSAYRRFSIEHFIYVPVEHL